MTDFVRLVRLAQTIVAAEKQRLIDRMTGDSFSEDLQHELSNLFRAEADRCSREIRDLDVQIDKVTNWQQDLVRQLQSSFSETSRQKGSGVMTSTGFKYWAWQIFTKSILGLIYFAVISEGLRQLVPVLGQRLYKLPLLSFLKDYTATYRLDLAPFFALFLLISVWYLWGIVLRIWVLEYEPHEYTDPHRRMVAVLAVTILGADTYLFYTAVSQMGWSGSFSFSAMIATAAYVGVLVFVLYVSQNLRVQQLEGE